MLVGVASVHGLEHGVRAGLGRQVQRRHEGAQRCEPRDDSVGQILGMARREPKALDSRRVHGVEHIGEARFPVQVAAIQVDV